MLMKKIMQINNYKLLSLKTVAKINTVKKVASWEICPIY